MTLPASPSRRTLPLSLVCSGETVELVDIRERGPLRQRLTELGLTRGAAIRVMQSDASGGMILALRQDTRLALARSAAQRILVSIGDDAAAD